MGTQTEAREQTVSFRGLTSFQLKVIAIITMLIDHTGAVLFPEELWLRYIGRLAFPIFCFLIVEGFYYTRDVKKYWLRLAIFALISEIPFDLAFHGKIFEIGEGQNVFFTLAIGLGMLYFMTWRTDVASKVCIALLAMLLAQIMDTDYGSMGVMLIWMFNTTRGNVKARTAVGIIWNFLFLSRIQAAGGLAMIPIACYNGKKGKSMKYFFYLFYPVHLLILYGLEGCL